MMRNNELNGAFDPACKPVFAQSAKQKDRLPIIDSRDLFYTLIHISENYGALFQAHHYLSLQFQAINTQHAAHFSKKYISSHLKQLLDNCLFQHAPAVAKPALADFMLHYAPLFFTELCWLAPITGAATSNTPLAAELMAMHLRLTQGTCNLADSRIAYIGTLLNLGLKIPDVASRAFVKQQEISEEIFELAAIQLCLRQFPRVFFPELLGLTLAYCHAMNLPEQLFSDGGTDGELPDLFVIRNQRRRQEISSIVRVIQAYLTTFSAQSDELWQRIQCGFCLYLVQTERCRQTIAGRMHNLLSPRQAMHQLLLKLMPHAIGHHGKIRLGAKTIDAWFKEKPFKSDNFLASLLHSPYVDRAKPEHSTLLKLFDFNGPMFGVLDDESKNVVRNWLLAELAPEPAQRNRAIPKLMRARSHKYGLQNIAPELTRVAGLFAPPAEHADSTKPVDYHKLAHKELFFYLVNHDIYPDVLPIAKAKAGRILNWAGLFCRLPFQPYTHQNFEDHVNALFQQEVKRYKPLSSKPRLSRKTYVWGIEQFAPTILVDGCWLRSVYQLEFHAKPEVAAPLLKIHADEAGDGIFQQNHPHIYQQLLDSLDIALPPLFSLDFVHHPGFIKHAFDIPVYLMAISLFPRSFLPELLGLNLAIEISGLGRVYPRLSEELNYWGIDSRIVDIHTSIDNLATGHSALAIKAIEAYLDDVLANQGNVAMQQHWRRIYSGFWSLNGVSWRFKINLIKHYLTKMRYA